MGLNRDAGIRAGAVRIGGEHADWSYESEPGQAGVEFTLTAERASDTAVVVRMEIPGTGKLKDLKSVTMDIGDYKAGVSASPLLTAALETVPGKKGSVVVTFQLAPELAEKCSIRLGPLFPAEPMAYEYYSVELKGYVTTRKPVARHSN